MKGNIKLKIKKNENENENEISLSIEHLTIEDSNELQNSNTSETTIVQDSGLKRNTIDKYYTVTQTVDICMKLISEKLNIGDEICAGTNAKVKVGNALPLNNIPLGTDVHNIELFPKKGGQLMRAAGTSARILAKENNFVVLRLSSKEIRLFKKECFV